MCDGSRFVRLQVTLHICGPILTAGSTLATWGMDICFYRDWKGRLAIPGSHVRGKLREAMTDLISVTGYSGLTPEDWFGKESGDDKGSYLPCRGILKVTDFLCECERTDTAGNVIDRIRIDPYRNCVETGALVMLESPFRPEEPVTWTGYVEFFSEETGIDDYVDQLKKAFLFITAIGAEKTVGFGRLEKVSFGTPEITSMKPAGCKIAGSADIHSLSISIAPEEPLFIGGTRRAENVFESETVIPGAVMKGAFASGLNRLAGMSDLNSPINQANSGVNALFPAISKAFTQITFLHARPDRKKFHRPHTIPLSGVTFGGNYEEWTFETDDNIYERDGNPVCFQVDWKGLPQNLPDKYKAPDLEYHPVTRTAIDPHTRKADESKLYSLHMVKPVIRGREKGQWEQIYWNSEILLPDSILPADKEELLKELLKAHHIALCYIGKRQSRVRLDHKMIKDVQPRIETGAEFAIVLQTPAIMSDPNIIAENSNKEVYDDSKILRDEYEIYWKEALGDGITLKSFFAAQELKGGYLVMRYGKMGYRPFYLTAAGSSFIFCVRDKTALQGALPTLLKNGLPLPEWAKKYYGEPFWKNCPFIRENGYGEIKIAVKEIKK